MSSRNVDTNSHEHAQPSTNNIKSQNQRPRVSTAGSRRKSASVQDCQGSEQADLLELQLLDVLAQALLKNPEDLLSSALTTIHSLAKGLLKLTAQAEDEVHHATPAGHWGSPHAAQLSLQTSNTCMQQQAQVRKGMLTR